MSELLFNVPIDEGKAELPRLVDPKNWATSSKVRKRVEQDVFSAWFQARDSRQEIQQRWNRYFALWKNRPDVWLYEGGLNMRVPTIFKSVETVVTHILGEMFPFVSLDNFEIEGKDPLFMQEKAAEIFPLYQLQRHNLRQSEIERNIAHFVRQGIIYGTAPAKIQWKTISSRNYRPRSLFNDAERGLDASLSGFTVEEREIFRYEGPTFKSVDMLRFYMSPTTARDIDDVRFFFEQIEVDWNHLLGMERKGIYHDVKRVKRMIEKFPKSSATPVGDSRLESEIERRLNIMGYNAQDVEAAKRGVFKITEAWGKFDLYGNGIEVDCQIVFLGDVILTIRQNPFWHQKPPYLLWRVMDMPDSAYGMGLIEVVEHLAYIANAIASQGADSIRFQNNQMMVVNRTALAGDPKKLRVAPRAIIQGTQKPEDILKMLQIPDTSGSAFALLEIVSGMIQDSMNAPPILQGRLGPKGTSATEIAGAQSGAQLGVNIMAKVLQRSVMGPMLDMWHELEQQFRAFKSHVEITGAPQLEMTPEQIVGDYKFRWLVGSEIRERAAADQAKLEAEQLRGPAESARGKGAANPGQTDASLGGQALLGAAPGGGVAPTSAVGDLGAVNTIPEI